MKTIQIQYRKNLFLRWFVLLIGASILYSCDEFLEVDLPASQLNTPFVFENKATANAAMVDIYAKMRDTGLLTGNSIGMSASLSTYTDELDYFGTPTSSLNFFFSNTLLPTTAAVADWWNNSYNQIYAANLVYKGVENSTTLNENDKKQFKGEALFARAMIHFHLVNLFDDIPYITTTDYRQNQTVSRMSAENVYAMIIADLELAKTLLPENYYGGTRVRPNKSVVAALLSRVYLYKESWAEAANEASYVLNQTGTYSFPQNINNTFLIQSPSTIWQLLPQASGRNTLEGATFIFTAAPPNSIALRNELINAFEEGDLRKSNWIKGVTNNNGTWYHAFKYKQRTITSPSMEHSIIFRLAEQYLIRAEARAKQGDWIGAKQDLNVIRSQAGLQNTEAETQLEILNAIDQERRVELFTETGHRFFDLKRTNRLDQVLSPIKPGWANFKKNLPIPEREFLVNPNLLPQNEGY